MQEILNGWEVMFWFQRAEHREQKTDENSELSAVLD